MGNLFRSASNLSCCGRRLGIPCNDEQVVAPDLDLELVIVAVDERRDGGTQYQLEILDRCA